MAKHQERKKPTPSFGNFSDYDANLNFSFRPYKISCNAYSMNRVSLEEAKEVAEKMAQYYNDVWITTPDGKHINVEDGTVEDFNEGVDNTLDFAKFATKKEKEKKLVQVK